MVIDSYDQVLQHCDPILLQIFQKNLYSSVTAQEQSKSKVNRWKKIIKVRGEINKIETRKNIEKFFLNKDNEILARLTMKKDSTKFLIKEKALQPTSQKYKGA